MRRIRNTFRVLGRLGIVVAVLAGMIAALSMGSYGFRWIWNAVPLGLAAFCLGFAILGVTFYFSSGSAAFERGMALDMRFRSLGAPQMLGLLYGLACLAAGIIWFVLPRPLLDSIPEFKTGFWFSVIGILMLFGIGECLRIAVLSLRIYWLGSVFYFAVSAIVFYLINSSLWGMTDGVPADYYVAAKLVTAFLILLQLCYLILIKAVPAHRESQKLATEKEKKAEMN